MSADDRDTTLNYWMDWLDAHRIDYTKIPNGDLVKWVNDMEEAVGDFFMDMIPDEWLDEWEDLPSEGDDVDE